MIFLFTDFGYSGPYIGQMKAVLASRAAGIPVIDLMHDAPRFRPEPSGHLLAALGTHVPVGSVVVAVVDPGVGSDRRPLVLRADGTWLVGPDNGLFQPWLARSASIEAWEITWRPERLSASFHGRDLFAPVAAMIAMAAPVPGQPIAVAPVGRGGDASVIYIDGFGNAMTGLVAADLPAGAVLRVGKERLSQAETFSAVPAGTAFWYVNSLGLAERAVPRRCLASMSGPRSTWPSRLPVGIVGLFRRASVPRCRAQRRGDGQAVVRKRWISTR